MHALGEPEDPTEEDEEDDGTDQSSEIPPKSISSEKRSNVTFS